MTVPINATDHFGLGANFHPQSSSAPTSYQPRNAMDENGNMECESMVGGKTEYTTTYKYCNASPDIKTDLGAILTSFGYVLSSNGATANIFVTSLNITFSDGEYADVVMTGISYADGTMPSAVTGLVANVAAAIPTGAGYGVPALTGVSLGSDAANSSLTINFSNNHIMASDGTGAFFAGNNLTFVANATAEYTGVPSSYTSVTSWTTDGFTPSDANTNFDATSWSGHRYFDKT